MLDNITFVELIQLLQELVDKKILHDSSTIQVNSKLEGYLTMYVINEFSELSLVQYFNNLDEAYYLLKKF